MFLALLMMLAAAAADPPTKPFVEPGTAEPDADRPIGSSDQWARMAIRIDKKGYAVRCRVIASNIRSSERRFWFCNAMMRDWHAEPVLKDGAPAEAELTRRMVLRGK